MDIQFVSITTWAAILLIAFGMLSGKVESGFISWFFFAFFVIAKILQWLNSRIPDNKKKP